MQQVVRAESKPIKVQDRKINAMQCHKCGAKIYPQSLFKAHLERHKDQRRWLATELKTLRHRMTRMRYFR